MDYQCFPFSRNNNEARIQFSAIEWYRMEVERMGLWSQWVFFIHMPPTVQVCGQQPNILNSRQNFMAINSDSVCGFRGHATVEKIIKRWPFGTHTKTDWIEHPDRLARHVTSVISKRPLSAIREAVLLTVTSPLGLGKYNVAHQVVSTGVFISASRTQSLIGITRSEPRATSIFTSVQCCRPALPGR